ncbi:hypothetical protein [Pseudaestuariivita atlantica]|uniref:CIS tube protein n=1 Tax=Pseudaestuariivita atlantica TaxID=1317121 RepID=UPI00067AEA77|nr:hypothetical protein [Pseudaestuariivita atlantica]
MLSKLKILAFRDKEMRRFVREIALQINPETLHHGLSTEFGDAIGSDTAGTILKFHTQTPQTMSFDFVIDSTGVVPGVRNVQDAVKDFRDLAYAYQGKIHSPHYLKLVWGGLTFKCMLSSLDVDYEMFDPRGRALRARLKAAFKQHQTPQEIARRGDKKSADLTHAERVTSARTLPGMTHDVYDRADLYPHVARANDLDDLVHLVPGAVLKFPPAES